MLANTEPALTANGRPKRIRRTKPVRTSSEKVDWRLTPLEKEELDRRADAAGLTISAYLRRVAIGNAALERAPTAPRVPPDAARLANELVRVGVLLNQIAESGHRGKSPLPPSVIPELEALRDELRPMIRTIRGQIDAA